MNRLEELKVLIAHFEQVQKANARFGAQDTEPDWRFHRVLRTAARERSSVWVPIPRTADGWELYDEPGAEAAAQSLHAATRVVVDFIQATTLAEAGPILDYLKRYAWRAEW